MAEALRPLKLATVIALLLLWGLPFLLSLGALAPVMVSAAGWNALAEMPHLAPQIALSLFIATCSTGIALAAASLMAVAANGLRRSRNGLSLMLATPHLAFAIGFGFLIMPAGLFARLMGFETPPQWVTTQDPYGLSLIAALSLKEAPFLLFLMLAALARKDFSQQLAGQSRAAASLGHGSLSIALRLLLPQLLRQMLWPIVIVWAYGLTVIDMAIVIGPTQPPPLQLTVWRDLNDVDPISNARGLAGALLLVGIVALAGLASLFAGGAMRPAFARWLARGPNARSLPGWSGTLLGNIVLAIHGLALAVLLIIALSPRWPFPQLLPDAWDAGTLEALLLSGSAALTNSLALAGASALLAVILASLWFAVAPPGWDRFVALAAIAALVLPAVAIASGQYVLALRAGLGGGMLAVFLAQFTPVFAYVFLSLRGPERAFDQRYRAAARSLNAGGLRFWWRIKAPLLAGPLATAAAIGFAVSLAQYVPVQLIGGGMVPTLTTEAVTLASGGSRQLLAAHAVALLILPALAFGTASLIARPRHA